LTSEDEGFQFCDDYARVKGFSVRKEEWNMRLVVNPLF
jgi:hypothetical protein